MILMYGTRTMLPCLSRWNELRSFIRFRFIVVCSNNREEGSQHTEGEPLQKHERKEIAFHCLINFCCLCVAVLQQIVAAAVWALIAMRRRREKEKL
jgi:hypothetical protein